MKKSSRRKSTSAPTAETATLIESTELDLFSSYSHEQVHIFDKLCSSVSSLCEIAYCTSDGITICTPETYKRETLINSSKSTSNCPMLIARIPYPHQVTDQNINIPPTSSSFKFFEKIRDQLLPNLYKAYKLRPTSLSPFDRLICPDTTQYKGFRCCLFCPFDVQLNRGQSILATVTCAHELYIYEILSSSNRFFVSNSSVLKIDLTAYLMEHCQFNKYIEDSQSEHDYRHLYFHLTSRILWNRNGTILLQLQYSGHLIVWSFDKKHRFEEPNFSIIDTKISKPMEMIWNEEERMVVIIGKENQRVLIRLDSNKLVELEIDENDFLNTDHGILLRKSQRHLLLIESKLNYCFVSSIDIEDKQAVKYRCDSIGVHVLPSSIVGLVEDRTNSADHSSISIGCEDGTIHSLNISFDSSLKSIDVKQSASGQIKTCSRKPLLLRHFNFSFNQILLARIFYSPIVSANVKFGFVICTIHRYTQETTMNSDRMIERFLTRTDVPLWFSFDELSVIHHDVQRGIIQQYQKKKSQPTDYLSLQRLIRLMKLFKKFSPNQKQIGTVENQFLDVYRDKLSSIFSKTFGKETKKLTPIETLIESICSSTKTNSLTSKLFPCPLCNEDLPLSGNDLLFTTCSNQHAWPRCCRTLLPLTLESAHTCSLCDRTINIVDVNDKNYSNFAKHKENDLFFFFSTLCSFCL